MGGGRGSSHRGTGKMFTHVDIPQESVTNQGSHFTSQLLSELYRLLHIRLILTRPYHPQMDGLCRDLHVKGVVRHYVG